MADKLWQYAVQLVIAFILVQMSKGQAKSIALGFEPKYFLVILFIWLVGIVLLSFGLTRALFYWRDQRKNRKMG